MPKFKKTRAELENELAEQMMALRASALAYDQGKRWEAKRLAATLYILFHDTQGGRTTSILGLLGKKAHLQMISSVIQPSAKLVAASNPLTMMRIVMNEPEMAPRLNTFNGSIQYPWLTIDKWYNQQIYHTISNINLTRKNMIFTMRTQDGGGHVDETISDEEYYYLTQWGDSVMQFEITGPNGVERKPFKYGVHAIMRQIAWEAEHSLSQIGL